MTKRQAILDWITLHLDGQTPCLGVRSRQWGAWFMPWRWEWYGGQLP